MNGPPRPRPSRTWTRSSISPWTRARLKRTTSAPATSQRSRTAWPKIGGGQIVFCNPPYGRAIAAWVRKCYEESRKPDTRVVMLIPARTDTAYFHDFIYHRAREIRFIRGRLRFNDAGPAPFPSMVVVF